MTTVISTALKVDRTLSDLNKVHKKFRTSDTREIRKWHQAILLKIYTTILYHHMFHEQYYMLLMSFSWPASIHLRVALQTRQLKTGLLSRLIVQCDKNELLTNSNTWGVHTLETSAEFILNKMAVVIKTPRNFSL